MERHLATNQGESKCRFESYRRDQRGDNGNIIAIFICALRKKNMRPSSITQEDIKRWDENIASDQNLPEGFADDEKQREVCYAALWLFEKLAQLGCEEENIYKLQYTAGRLSYYNDPWEVHQQVVKTYKEVNQVIDPWVKGLN